jgi:hypothetical protein
VATPAELAAGLQRQVDGAVPDAAVARAKAAYNRRARVGTVAVLAFDSNQVPRLLRFAHPSVSIDVTVAADGDRRELRASAANGQPVAVERYAEPPVAPVVISKRARFGARRGDLLRVAVGTTLSEWFRV